MEYLTKLKSTVSSVAASVSSALPGNPVTREYEVAEQIASAGPGLSWKIYNGEKKSTKQPVAVWVFEKRDIERWPRKEKEMFVDLVKNGIGRLTRIRHPRVLIIEHPIEESRESLAFCTEPVFASLANCLGRIDNMPAIIPEHLTEFQLLDVEIKHGLCHLSEALAFLHNDAKMLHRNICPESIIINSRGAWKLAGFDFCVNSTAQPATNQTSYAILEWDCTLMPCVQPSLDYLAPEYILSERCEPASDCYSLGVLSYAIYNKGKTPFDHSNNMNTFKSNAKLLKSLPPKLFHSLPVEFREDVKMCLNYTPDLRPDATQFSKIAYFDDILVKTLNYFESLCQMDNVQKSEFFKGLPNVLAKFPKRPLLQQVLPYLAAEFSTPDLIPFILPSVFLIAEQTTNSEFANSVLPHLVPVFTVRKPYQVSLMLLQKMELLLNKTPEEDVRRLVLPLIYNALDSDTAKVQELVLGIIPNVGKYVNRDSMKTTLLPKLLNLCTTAGVLSVKVNALVCLGKLLNNLEKWMVTDQVLPTLPKINSHEPGVLMAILGIYRLVFDNPRMEISKDTCAKSALPFLISSSVDNSLNLGQFEQFVSLINVMMNKVENEQRSRLQQLSAMQEEQRSVKDFNEVLTQTSARQAVSPELRGLEALEDISKTANKARSPQNNTSALPKGPLSLEEKKRIAAEQEQNIKMRSQPNIKPTTMAATNKVIGHQPMRPTMNSSFSQKVCQNPIDLNEFLPTPPRPSNPIQRYPPPMMSSPPMMSIPPISQAPTWSNPEQNNFGSFNQAPFQQQNVSASKMDLSAFDSLVAFPKNSNTAMTQPKKNTLNDLLG